jgi:quercetin dioxygenase-like cupin family protein
VRVDLDPGDVSPKHRHPGEEVIYVLQGAIEYQVEGRPTRVCKAGDVLMIPARAVHRARNIGSAEAAELATYIVEKGKPVASPAK